MISLEISLLPELFMQETKQNPNWWIVPQLIVAQELKEDGGKLNWGRKEV